MELTSYAPSCTVQAAVCPFLGFDKNGRRINPRNGQPLKVKSLKDIVYSQLDIPEDRQKGTSGSVFAISYDKMYSVNDKSIDFHSSGAVFVDLDHVNEQEIENINNNFDKFIYWMPDMLGMHLSYSGKGFHLYFLSDPLSKIDYLKWQIGACLRFNKSYEKIFGVPLPNTIFDPAQTGVKQRFFLNRPYDMQIHWNDSAIVGNATPFILEEVVDKHIGYYDIKDENGKSRDSIYTRWKSATREPSENKQPRKRKHSETEQPDYQEYAVTRKNVRVKHLSHPERMRLYSSLRVAFNDNKQVVANEWSHCMHLMEYSYDNSTQLEDALAEPDRNQSWKTYQTPHISREFYLFYDIDALRAVCPDSEIKESTYELTEEERALLAKYI